MPVINKSPFPKTDKMGRKVPDGEAEFINKHEVETVVRDEKTGTASDDTFQAKNIPVTNFKRQSAMTYEQAAVDKVLRIHNNLAFDRKIIEYFSVTEAKMTEAEKSKREKIVMSLKNKMGDFKKKYGKRAEEVMYATATKMAMEGYDLSETPVGMSPGQSVPATQSGVGGNPGTVRRPTPRQTLPPLGGANSQTTPPAATPAPNPAPEPRSDRGGTTPIPVDQQTRTAPEPRSDRGGTTPIPVDQQTRTSRTPANPNYKGSAGAQAIQKANSIENVNKIRAGQVIKVNGQNYTVKPGDSLDKIARNNPARPTTPASSGHSAPPQRNTAAPAAPSNPAPRSNPQSNPSPYAPRSPMNNDQSNAPIGRPSTFPTPPTNPGQGNPRDRGR
jgi:hypothetical protein